MSDQDETATPAQTSTANDNETPQHPPDMPANDRPLSLEEQMSHAVMQLALHERSIRRFVLVRFPNGQTEPLGELLMRIGAALFEERAEKEVDAPRPKLSLVHSASPATGLAQMADSVRAVAASARAQAPKIVEKLEPIEGK
jgi:hypothetical protein